jgi:hypothetical protein
MRSNVTSNKFDIKADVVIPIAIGIVDTQESLTRLPNKFDIKADVVIPIAIGMADMLRSLT